MSALPRFVRRTRALRAAGALVLAAGLVGVAPTPAQAAGTYDPNFFGGGRVTMGGSQYRTADVTTGPNDEVVTVGIIGALDTDQLDVRKMSPTGTPDPAFAGDGNVQVGGGLEYTIPAVAVDQASGLIYVTGYDASANVSRIWRFTPAGALDPAWGAGKGVMGFPSARFTDVTVDASGRPIVTNGAALYRFATSGSIDTSFGVSGGVTLPTSQLDNVQILGNGDLMASGRGADSVDLFRVRPNGSLATSFGNQGKGSIRMTPTLGWTIAGMAQTSFGVQNDGRVVVASGLAEAASGKPNRSALVVVRFKKSGYADGSFFVHRDYPLNISGTMAMQRNDKAVIGVYGAGHAGMIRLLPDGKLDPGFGTGGGWGDTTKDSRPTAVTVQATGRIVGAGFAPGTSGLLWGLTGDQTPSCQGRLATAYGSNGKDTFEGTDGDDVIVGLGGKDTIKSGKGSDRICGGGGADKIKSGGGNDKIDAAGGNDKVWGGPGKDKVRGGAGHDKLWGGGGNDTLKGEKGNDRLWGGPGNDKLYGGKGKDRIVGGPGKDKIKH